MDISLKQRLIGAAVLIALAVIFVPMLLDGAGRREQLTMNMEIPPEPKFTFKYDAPPPPQPAHKEPKYEQSPSAPPEPPQSSRGDQFDKAEPVSPGREPAQEVVERMPEKTEPKPEPKPKQTVAAEPVQPLESERPNKPKAQLSAAAPNPGWVVQVGSFSKEDNARAFLKQLNKDGYAAFLEKGGEGSKQVYRVKVGPVASKAQAVSLKWRLKSKRGVEGIVMNHAPNG